VDEFGLLEFQTGDAFETFLEVWLHAGWVLRLAQNLQQLLVGQEEETWETDPFGLQVRVQPLLDYLQVGVALL